MYMYSIFNYRDVNKNNGFTCRINGEGSFELYFKLSMLGVKNSHKVVLCVKLNLGIRLLTSY